MTTTTQTTTAHTNGTGPASLDDEINAILDEAQINVVDTLSADAIADLLPSFKDYAGEAWDAAKDALRALIAPLSAEERKAVELPLLQQHAFKNKRDLDAFLASVPPPPGEPIFHLESLAELFSRPDKVWLIDQVIGAGDVGMIYGMPGCNKTFTVIDMIFAACLGQQWAMRFSVARPLNVVYAAGEGVGGLKERFRAAAVQYNVTDYLPGFHFSALVPQLFNGNGEAMSQFVTEWKARQANGGPGLDLLIIDTLHSATVGADENSAQDMGQVLSEAKLAARELGCAVLLVHHTNKTGSAERGSSALRGAMDVMIEIRRISDTGTKAVMHCAKIKDGEAWKDQTFDLVAVDDCESVRVWWDPAMDGETGDKRKSQTGPEILEVLNSGEDGRKLTAKQIGDALGISQQAVNRVITRLVKDGLAHRHDEQNSRGAWLFSITPEGKKTLDSDAVDDDALSKQGL